MRRARSMFDDTPFLFLEGYWYTAVHGGLGEADASLGEELSPYEAESLLSRALGDPAYAAEVRQLYARLVGYGANAHVQDHTVLSWLRDELHAFFGPLRILKRRELLPRESAGAAVVSEEAQEAQRVDSLIAELGRGDLQHRGRSYRVSRAADHARLKDRQYYEAISDADARRVLTEMQADAHRAARHKEVLAELLSLFDKAKRKQNAPEMVMLRLVRLQVVPADQGPPMTPSQMRETQQKRTVTLQLVDEWGNPKGDIGYKFYAPAQAAAPGSFPPSGEKKHEGVEPGTAQVSLGVHPDDWFERAARPLGYLAEEFELTLVDELGIPIADQAFTATF